METEDLQEAEGSYTVSFEGSFTDYLTKQINVTVWTYFFVLMLHAYVGSLNLYAMLAVDFVAVFAGFLLEKKQNEE